MFFGSWIGRALDLALGVVVSTNLFTMMLITFLDVIGRYVLNAPLPGGTELTQLLLATLILGALPIVTRRGENITIDLFDTAIPARWRPLRDRVVEACSAPVYAALAWLMWAQSQRLAAYGDYTETLRIPLAPVVYFMAAMFAISAAFSLLRAFGPRQAPTSGPGAASDGIRP